MEPLNGIYDLFKYNMFIQKVNENDYKSLFLLIIGFSLMSLYNRMSFNRYNIYKYYLHLYYKKYTNCATITMEGQHLTKHTSYTVKVKTLMSDNFKAIWGHIFKLKKINIYNLLECFSDFSDDYSSTEERNNDDSMFVVDQSIPFEIENDIYCSVEILQNNDEENNKSTQSSNIKIDCKNIILKIFSFKHDINFLTDYIDNIKKEYLKSIEDTRKELRFHYKLKDIDTTENIINWYEKEFNTNKTFDKMYLKNQTDILKKINFFLENEQWYKDEGHPYTLGIGLYGPPGTGKTSFIKCLAKMTNRHIIEISLNKIKTESQLFDVYYDTKYHKFNKEPIDFRKKIIILEDIDCSNDIVLKREYKKENSSNNSNVEVTNIMSLLTNQDIDSDEDKKSNYKKYPVSVSSTKSDLTLSSLLNILDGISEDEGRILIMTSNCWNKLDPALIRPGRIDMEIEMSHIDENILNEFVYKNYKKRIPEKKMKNIKLDNITPCIMINERSNSKTLVNFIEKLEKY